MTETKTRSKLAEIGQEWKSLFSGRPDYYVISNPETILTALNSPVVGFLREACGIRGNERVLEAGCGSGLYGLALATMGCDCTELDVSAQMLANVENAAAMMASSGFPLKVTAVQKDLTAIDLPDDAFDVTFNEGVVEHWVNRPDRIHILREMVRVTRPGGRVMVCIPNNSHPFYPWWYFLQRTFNSRSLVFRPGGALEEAIISAPLLADDLRRAGLVDILVDGFAVTRSLSHYPRWLPLKAVSKGLELVLPPFPPDVRKRFGVYLVARGVKAETAPGDHRN